jgi:hypothetical protein
VLGAGLGAVLMEIAGLPVSFDWGSVGLLTGAGVGVVVAVARHPQRRFIAADATSGTVPL